MTQYAAHSAPTTPSRRTASASRWWTSTISARPHRGLRRSPPVRSRRRSGGAGLGLAGLVGGLEAVAAAAGLGRLGGVDREAAAHERVDVVDLGALDVLGGEGVDVDGKSVELGHLVVRPRRILVQPHPVGEAGEASIP